MGDSSQPKFLKSVFSNLQLSRPNESFNLALITGAALEGHSSEIIKLVQAKGYKVLTTDIEGGKGVDVIWDLQCSPPLEVRGSVDLFISCSVLEHVPDVSIAAKNITAAMRQNGKIYLSVPWVWRYHRYSDDYHRFHASSLNQLFPETKALARAWSTSPDGKLHKFEENLDQRLSRVIDGVKFLPYLMLHELRVMSKS